MEINHTYRLHVFSFFGPGCIVSRCLVPRRQFNAGKQGARGVVGRMQDAAAVHLSHNATRTIT